MNRFFLDLRTARATWTILMFLGALGLAYAERQMLSLLRFRCSSRTSCFRLSGSRNGG